MRKQADTNHTRGDSADSVPSPAGESHLLRRVQELERVVDVHTAIVRKLVSHLEHAETGASRQSSPGAHDASPSTLDDVAEGFVACPNCETRIAVALRADPPF
jgi:hypothetical protein